jgi:ribosomal protein L40E
MSSPQEIRESRLQQAEKIASQPDQYKVCEGCGCIVSSRATTCPSCHAYLFDDTPERVISQARALALKTPVSVLSSDMA